MSFSFVIFGASGDLTSRKLIPALYRMYRQKRLTQPTRIVGCARSAYTDDAWREKLRATTEQFVGAEFDAAAWQEFAKLIFYQPLDLGQPAQFDRLALRLAALEPTDTKTTRIYYLATSPKLYETAVANLGGSAMASEEKGPRRVVIEKPFGTDLSSAQRLNTAVHEVFHERQVYRIDHYLGKETVQNLLVLRFGNSIFEPIWNRNYVDNIQITVAEEVTVGQRGSYYDKAGVLRDMFQNHLLQLLTITAMEAPIRYDAQLVRDEKVKVLQAIRRLHGEDFAHDTVRGQYDHYRQEPGVPDDSQVATFAVIKLLVDTWRWKNVPFYLRSGKGMSCRSTQIVVEFQEPPHSLFDDGRRYGIEGNRLVIQIQPAEGIQLQLQTKVPDSDMALRMTDLDFRFNRAFAGSMPDAYQRLLLDAAEGDASLFARSDEVELAWGIIDPILHAWDHQAGPPLLFYPTGEWGPRESTQWMQRQGRNWFDVCPVLH